MSLSTARLQATIIDWNGSSSTTFSTNGNWAGGTAPANSTATDIARFGNIVFTNQPTLTANRSINGLIFTGNTTVTLSGATRTLTIGSSGITNSSTSGTQTVGTLVSLGAAQSFTNDGTLVLTGNIANGTNLLTLTGIGAGGSISGIIGNGSGGITKSGTGTWALSGVNTYTGATTINAGTLSVATIGNGGVAGNLGAAAATASNLTLGGGTLRYTGATASTNRNFVLTAGTTSTIDVSTGANTLTISGASTATTGGLTKAGAGTLTLSGANLYTGATTVSAGTLKAGVASVANTSGAFGNNSAVTLANTSGVTLNITGFNTQIGSLTGGGTTGGNVTLGAATLTVGGDNTSPAAFAGAISGTGGSLTKIGTGTLTLSGTNTYTGTTTVNAGTLLANGSASLGDTVGNVTVTAGTLSLAGGADITLANPTNAQTITKSGTLTLAGSGATASTGALHAAGSTGQTSQWIGNIVVSSAATMSAADNLLRIGNGATYANTLTLNGTLTLNTTSATGVTPVNLADTVAPYDQFDATNILINSRISGTGGITKTGTGTATIVSFPSNSFSGATTVTGGKLIIDGAGGAPVISSTSVTVGNSSGAGAANSVVLQMGQTAGSLASVNDMIGTSSASSATTSMTVYSDGLFNMNGGSNSLVNLSLGGGHVSGGNPAYSALLTVTGSITSSASAQTAVIDNGYVGMSSNSFAFNVADGAATTDLRVDSVLQNGVGFTGGSAGTSLSKTGTGTLLLTAANTYAGVTAVQAGVLAIQNSAALGQGGATSANGTTVAAGAQLQLDGSVGNLTIANESLTLSGNGSSTTGELRSTSGTNTYNGFITLAGDSRINADAGTLTIANTVGTGASIINGDVAGRTLTLGGAGDIAVNSVIASNIGTIVKDNTGTVTLGGDYAANITTTVNDGTLALNMGGGGLSSATTVTIGDSSGSANSATLLLAQSNQIANAAAVTVNSDGKFDVNGKSETIGSIAGSGNIVLGTGQLIVGDTNNTTFSGKLAGAAGSSVTKVGAGTLTISSNVQGGANGDFLGDLNLNAGTLALLNATDTFTGTLNVAAGTTLKLTDSTLNIANLNFTGSGTITLDFSGTASTLNVTGILDIAAGITLNIINWQNASDFFYAANWNGAVLGTTGTGVETQVIFDAPTWTGANTKWQSYDHQITPVPEPSTYGALLLGAMGALLGYRRCRQTKPAAKA